MVAIGCTLVSIMASPWTGKMDVKRLSIKVAVSGVKSNSHIIYKTWSNTIDGDGAQWLSLAIGTHGRGDIVDIVGNSYRSITPINDLHVPIAGPSPSKNFFKAFILSYLPHSKKTCIGHNLALSLLCSPYLLYFCLLHILSIKTLLLSSVQNKISQQNGCHGEWLQLVWHVLPSLTCHICGFTIQLLCFSLDLATLASVFCHDIAFFAATPTLFRANK